MPNFGFSRSIFDHKEAFFDPTLMGVPILIFDVEHDADQTHMIFPTHLISLAHPMTTYKFCFSRYTCNLLEICLSYKSLIHGLYANGLVKWLQIIRVVSILP